MSAPSSGIDTSPGDRSPADDAEGNSGLAAAARRLGVAFGLLVLGTLVLGGIGELVVFDTGLGEAETEFVDWLADSRTAAVDTVAKIGAVTDTWTAIGVMFGSMTILVAIDRRRLAALILVAMALELSTFLVVGAVIDRPRPEAAAAGPIPSTPSFPSGHAAGTIALYGSLMIAAWRVSVDGRVNRRIAVALPISLGAVVGATRVYEGLHYPSDVVVGLVMGAGALAGALYVTDLRSSPSPERDAATLDRGTST